MSDIPTMPFDPNLFETIDPKRLTFEFRSGLDCKANEKPKFYFILWKYPWPRPCGDNPIESYIEMPESTKDAIYDYVQERCDADLWDSW